MLGEWPQRPSLPLLGPWLWLLLGCMGRGMDPTGVRILAPEEPAAAAAAAARILCMLLPLLPPVLCMLARVPSRPSMKGVSVEMARKLRRVEAEEPVPMLGLALPPDGRILRPC